MKLLALFIVLNVLNVIIQTVKSICTIKCGKTIASLVNALAYGLYTVVLVYMQCDLSLFAKVMVVGGANLVGVYVVKVIEEKMRADKLWKIETTVKNQYASRMETMLKTANIPFSVLATDDKLRKIYNIYCATQKESLAVKEILKNFNAKYFVAESKTL